MKKKKIVLFLGPPGAGKGSLSQLCVKRLGWQQLSTGNLCREHIAQGTDIGKEIDFAMKSGKLIADSLIIDMVDQWLASSQIGDQTIIFDGFPRTVPQAASLQELVESHGDIEIRLLRLAIDDKELVYRLSARSICQNKKCMMVYSLHKDSALLPKKSDICNECQGPLVRRPDDEESAIRERLRIYHEHERGLLGFFESIGHLINTVEASLPLEKVYVSFIDTTGFVNV